MYSWLGEKENEKKKEEGGGTSVSLVQLKPLLGLYSVYVIWKVASRLPLNLATLCLLW